jgi:hypothetical protein
VLSKGVHPLILKRQYVFALYYQNIFTVKNLKECVICCLVADFHSLRLLDTSILTPYLLSQVVL